MQPFESRATEADAVVLSQISDRLYTLSREGIRPTHILLHPETLSQPVSSLFGLPVRMSPWMEIGKAGLLVVAP